MRMNSLMRPLWGEVVETENPRVLPEELRDLIRGGWRIGPADSLLLVGCYGDGSGWRDDWQVGEVSRHELEVNDVRIPCDDLPRARDVFLRDSVARSRAFIGAALMAARGFQSSDQLVAIVSVGVDDDYRMHGVTIKFATRRGGFPEVYENLERYGFEAMAVIELPDVSF
ncbi:hypothetical protein ACWGK1_00410 [Streptomyces wedmorensis]